MSVAPSRVNFNNVTSLGVSYQWSHGMKDGAPLPCTGITNQAGRETGKWVERVRTLDIEVANLDLDNNGGNVVAQMAAQQSRYVNTSTHSIYTNGLFAGNGYLTSYSINEGSLSNSSVTNLQYTMRDGGEDQNETTDDPIQRSESIKVSRDVKGKSYTIDHSYSVSYGSDWDLVTDYPLYEDDPAYKSVDGRLALAEQEATAAVDNDVTDYNQYIDLSAYTLSSGFNLTKINNGCSGVFTSSNSTKNFINGDFSYSKTTVLRYTGADFDPDIEPYTVSYTIGWDQQAAEGEAPCVELTFQGSITANEGSVLDCSDEAGGVGAIAESGFKEWVTPDDSSTPKGLTKVIEFFEAVSGAMSLPGAKSYPLVEEILSYKKKECAPSVNKGAKNDGTIDFEFKVSNCPENNVDGTQYVHEENSTVSFSVGGCEGAKRRITSISVDGSVNGQCGRNYTENGTYERWNSVESIYNDLRLSGLAKGPPLYEGAFNLRLQQESTAINKYEGNGSYNFQWTDSPADQNCGPIKVEGCNSRYQVSSKIDETPVKPRYVNTVTADGIVSEQKGESRAMKSASIEIVGTGNSPSLTIANVLEEAKCQGNLKGPGCAITDLSVSLSKEWQNGAEEQKGGISVGGIDA